MLHSLFIQEVENGWIVNESHADRGRVGKQWVFNTPLELAYFIREFAQGQCPTEGAIAPESNKGGGGVNV